jgi:hypothetical protein
MAERVGGILSSRFGRQLGWGKRERERGMGPRPQMAADPTNRHNNQIKSAWQWGGRLGGRATGEERAGDSRGVALAVKLINKKRKNIIRHGLEPPPGNNLHTTTEQRGRDMEAG